MKKESQKVLDYLTNIFTDFENTENKLNSLNQQLTATEQQLRATNQQLIASEHEIKKHAHDLEERVKELGCFYGISETVRKRETIEEILQDITKIIPPAWQYPEITCAKISFGNMEYKTDNYEDSKWKLISDIIVKQKIAGKIEVCYLEQKSQNDVGPFLKEERILLDNITERLGRIIESKNAEEELKATNQQLIASNQQLIVSEQQLKTSMKQIKESEEKYHSLVTNIPDVIWTTDCEGNTSYISPNIKDIYGYSPEEIYKDGERSWFGRIHPEDVGSIDKAFKDLFEKGAMFDVEYRIKRKDGEWIWLHDRSLATYEKDGIMCADGIFTDITKRKQAEEELKESEKRFRSLFNANRDGYIIVRGNGEVLNANPVMLEMMGYSIDELKMKNFWKFTPEKWVEKEKNEQGTLLLERGYTDLYEKEYIRKDGSVFPIEVQAYILEKGEDIDSTRIGGFVRDITERKNAELIQSVLYNISNAVNTTDNLDELYKIIHFELGKIIDTTNFYIANYNEETGEIISPYFVDEVFDEKPPVKLRKNGFSEYLIKMKKSLYLTLDLRKKLVEKGEIVKRDWKSKIWLGVPLKTGNKIVGCLAVLSYKDESIYTEKDLLLLEFVSDQVAVAIARKQAEEKEEHLNAVLSAIRNVNQIIVKEKNRKILIKKACENFIQTRGFQSAWIALFDEKNKLTHFEGEGLDENFQKLKENLSHTNLPQCINIALQQDEVVSISEVSKDCGDCPLVKMHIGKNRGVMSRSLKYGSNCYGVVNVSLALRFIDDKEEHSLFDEVAGDIAYALYNMEVEEQRQKADEALAEKTMLLDNIINRASSVAIATTDLDLRITSYNPIAQKFFGYTPEEVLGRTVMEMHLKNNVESERLEKAIEIVRETGEYNYFVTQEIPGGKRVLSSRVSGMLDPSGKMVGFVLFSRDVTELVTAEEELSKSESNLRTLFNAMTDIVFEMDYDGRYINIAPTSPELMFKPPEDIIGKTLYEVFPKPEADIFLEFIRNSLNENKTKTIEYPLFIKGKTIWFEGRATPKTRNSVLYIARDITERKLAEEALQKSESQYRLLAVNAVDFIFYMDLKLKFIYLSPYLYDSMGYHPEEVVGTRLFKYTSRKEFIKIARVAFGAIKNYKSDPVALFETKLINKSGQEVPVEISGRVVLNKKGKPIGIQGSVRDITERRKAESVRKTLYDISAAINTTDNLHLFCQKVREFLGNVIDTTNFYVALYDEKTDMISLPFDVDEKDEYETFPAGKTLTAYILKTGKPLLVDNKLLTKLIKEGKVEDIGAPSKIWLGAPLKVENKVIGVVVVQSYDDPNLYTKKDIKILSFVSEEIALAIKHSRAADQIKQDLKIKTALIQEIYHRTKNNMAVISAMLSMQSRRSKNEYVKTTFREINNKIQAMSLVHQKLYKAKDLSNINLKVYIEDLANLILQSYGVLSEKIKIKFDLQDVRILIDSAVPLGLIVNELVSNIFKHAFPNRQEGEIYIRLIKEKDETITLEVIDNGIGFPQNFNPRKDGSMGLASVFSIVENQLKGEISVKSGNGLKWHIKIKDDKKKERV